MKILNLLFILPNIIDIFPEIKLFIPKWSVTNKNRKKCITDLDCYFPASCCNIPFNLEKECCTGFGHRISQSNYAFN